MPKKTAKNIYSFLGLIGYYRKFIENCKIKKTSNKMPKKREKIAHTT